MLNSQTRNILNLYAERFNVMNSNSMSARGQAEYTPANMRYELINLSVFIAKDWFKRDMAKWHVLDTCVIDVL